MTEDKSKIISKISKVLALATNNPIPEEGQAAMLLAQKMMVENNLEFSDIVVKTHSKEIINESIKESTRILWWYKKLSRIIARNFKCYNYVSISYRSTSIKFIGLKEDVELAKQIFNYATEIISYHYNQYIKNNKIKSSSGIKNQYILGFLNGLEEKFTEQVKQNNWGLIIVKDSDVTKEYEKLKCRTVNSNLHLRMDDVRHRMEGHSQGKQFEIISGSLR